MAKTQIDVRRLYAALDGARTERNLSWRGLAKDAGVSPSLLSRLGNGYKPDAEGFMTLVRWLGMKAEDFATHGDTTVPEGRQPDLMAELAPLLRARTDLDQLDLNYLEQVIGATVRRVQAERSRLP
ncbi:XRE family transcriptional regulator [Geodermatophilus sp. DF01-2]|uniref:helix-turn-helix transcriptional regulator n=1 Tax=Geodermatophilus sp. DF01-2 TaxID=2559610 RepID=UPI001073F601|nr:helix-turn-helix transcriptional regulator [Geodermatophilus sp. DF01_2]TFV57741.1 XRE family transcriptional regulator [Geodermatophilus sp. DF01_2]